MPGRFALVAIVSLLATLVADTTASPLTDANANVTLVRNASFHCVSTPSGCVRQSRLRVTSSVADSVGAVWAKQAVAVADGFMVSFRFRTVSQSQTCPFQDGIFSNCRTRGGHGFAFVVQNDGASFGGDTQQAVGAGGSGLGYAGLNNSVAVEFDMWYDAALGDAFDNHISVQVAEVAEGPVSANHRYSLGVATDVPEMADDRVHTVRIVYAASLNSEFIHPILCAASGTCGKLRSTTHFGTLLGAGSFTAEHGVGTISVYVDDFVSPVLIAPYQAKSLMTLASGTSATIGFTAATGSQQWQTHEVWDWQVCKADGTLCRGVFDFSSY